MRKHILDVLMTMIMVIVLCSGTGLSVQASQISSDSEKPEIAANDQLEADDDQVEAAVVSPYELIDCTDSYTEYGIAVSNLNQDQVSIASEDGSASEKADADCRLLLQAHGEMDFSEYGPNKVVAGPDYNYTLYFSSEEAALAALEALKADSRIIYAEPDGIISLDPEELEPEESDEFFSNSSSEITHNSWGCAELQVDKYISAASAQNSSNTVTVAVVDTGVDYTHTFLKDRMVYNSDGSIAGYDFVDSDSDPIDENTQNSDGEVKNTYHGTHCAGIVADCTQTLNVKIMAVRVLNVKGSGYSSSVASGIEYAVEHGAQVISCSLGGTTCSQAIESAVALAVSKGVTVCVAAGNNGYSLDENVGCPAHISSAITVASINSAFTRASSSNYGSVVDVCAPGVKINSCKGGGTNSYQLLSGTSMATPHVAAMASMLLLADPTLTPEEISDKLKASCKDLGDEGRDDYYGDGLPQMDTFVMVSDVSEAPADGSTSGQPFSSGTGDSTYYRIPAMVTLDDGTIVAAADARWDATGDGGGNDTVVSYSKDNGSTWNYTFANYLGDNGNVHDGSSTCFIDPCLATDGTDVYMLVDLWPGGYALNSADHTPVAGENGFDSDGRLRLSADSRASYGYYLENGQIYSNDGTAVSGLKVDAEYNITGIYNGKLISSNLFFEDSPFQVYPTNYLYLKKSTDGGATWSDPTLINVKKAQEQSCLVGPGTGLVVKLDDGTSRLIFSVYNYTNGDKNTSVIYSDDGGATWTRSADMSAVSSEGSLTQVGDRLYLFTRHGGYYTSDDFGATWSECQSVSGISYNTSCELNVLTYSKTIDGKQAILLSAPGSTTSRQNGKIFIGLIQDDGSISWEYTYAVNNGIFQYSDMAELSDGSIGLLYENGNASITYINLAMTDVASGAEIGKEVEPVQVALEDTPFTSGNALSGADDQKLVRLLTSVGQTYNVDSTLSDGTWSIQDKSIATVDQEGKVTGVSAGETGLVYRTDDAAYLMPIVVRDNAGSAGNTKNYEFYVADNTQTVTYMAICNNSYQGMEEIVQGEAICLNFAADADTAIDFFSKIDMDEDEQMEYLLDSMADGSFYALTDADELDDCDFYTNTDSPVAEQIADLGDEVVTQMLQAAIDKGCIGAAGYTSGNGDGDVSAVLKFAAEKVPDFQWEIVSVNGTDYTEGMTIHNGDVIDYQVTVTKPAYVYDVAIEGAYIWHQENDSTEDIEMTAGEAYEKVFSGQYTVRKADIGIKLSGFCTYDCMYTPVNGEMLGGMCNGYIETDIIPVAADYATVNSVSLTLDGTIGVNFYVDLPDQASYITLNDEKISVSEGKNTDDVDSDKSFTYSVSVKKLNDEITLNVYDKDGQKIDLKNSAGDNITDTGCIYSAMEYINTVIADQNADQDLVALLKALSDYGSYAQTYFNYNNDHIAEIYNADDIAAVTADTLAGFDMVRDGEVDGLNYYGNSLLLGSGTTDRIYFSLEDGAEISNYTFTLDGNSLEPVSKGSLYYISINDIPAAQLSETHELIVKGTSEESNSLTMTFSPLSYVGEVLSMDNADAGLTNMMKALYLYYAAAKNYFS